MRVELDRRGAIGVLVAGLVASGARAAEVPAAPRDFDFFFGRWRVAHRRLKARMVGSSDWEEFAGEILCWPLMGGIANLNDSVSWRGGVERRGLGLRAFDAASGKWADWTLSGSAPLELGAPGVGQFAGNAGTFLSNETLNGRPIVVRGIFTAIRPGLAQWEQAFSGDAGQSWETNWVMRYTRTAELAEGMKL